MASIPENISCPVADPTRSHGFIYASDPDAIGSYGIYRGTSLDSGTLLTSKKFEDVSMIQATSDGSVFILGVVSGVRGLYVVRSGTATIIDTAEAAMARPDGASAVYAHISGDNVAIVLWTASNGGKRTVVPTGFNHSPAISRDGTQIVYSALNASRGDFDLYTIATSGGSAVRLTNTAGRNEFGASFDETGGKLSYSVTGDSDAPGIYVYSGGVSTRIVGDLNVSSGTYWSTSQGRSYFGVGMSRFSKLPDLRRH